MEKKIVYDLDFDDLSAEDMEGVFSISLVHKPAIESNFITLSEEKTTLAAVDDSKRILMGAVLIPNVEMLRKDGTYIRFSPEVIRKCMESFFQREYQRNASIEHNMESSLEEVCIVESWQVEDTEKDKSSVYNLSYEVGTWVACMKVDEDTYKLAKEGKVNGYSIEGLFPIRTLVDSSVQLSEELDTRLVDEISAMSELELDLLADVCNEAMNIANSKEEAIEFIKQILNS